MVEWEDDPGGGMQASILLFGGGNWVVFLP